MLSSKYYLFVLMQNDFLISTYYYDSTPVAFDKKKIKEHETEFIGKNVEKTTTKYIIEF